MTWRLGTTIGLTPITDEATLDEFFELFEAVVLDLPRIASSAKVATDLLQSLLLSQAKVDLASANPTEEQVRYHAELLYFGYRKVRGIPIPEPCLPVIRGKDNRIHKIDCLSDWLQNGF